MAKILVVDDDRLLTAMIKEWLERERHSIEEVHNGSEAMDLLKHYQFDLAILDWGLPQLDGIQILKEFRSRGGNMPILFLTGRKTILEKEAGFEAGADDYLVKPFDMRELSVRVLALLRRAPAFKSTVLQCGPISLDTAQGRVTRDGVELKLFPKEYALLEFFLRHPNHIFSVDDLLNHIWKSDSEATTGAVRTNITRLRQKIEVENGPRVVTVHGLGYMFETGGKDAADQ